MILKRSFCRFDIMKDATNKLGEKIRLLRHQNKWSQGDVAKQLEISIPAFSKIETGITDVNISRLRQISDLFGLTLVELLTFSDQENDKQVTSEIEELRKKLKEREDEVIDLQKKVIHLYDELHKNRS